MTDTPSDPDKEGVFITAVAHEGLSVLVNGRPGRLAILDEAGNVVASGPRVAREAEAVAINSYRDRLIASGRLRVHPEAPGVRMETLTGDGE